MQARKAIETGERQILSKSGRWSLEITPSYEPKPPEPEPPKPFDLSEFIEFHLKNPEVLLLYVVVLTLVFGVLNLIFGS